MHDNRVVPVLSVDSYVVDNQWDTKKPIVVTNGRGSDKKRHGPLKEIVEGVFYIEEDLSGIPNTTGMKADVYAYLVTRQIGTSDKKRWPSYGRISVVYERNGEIHVWEPLMEEILDCAEQMSETGIRWVQNLLEYDKRRELIAVHRKENVMHSDFLIKRTCFGDKIPEVVMREVIRNVFISEDKQFKHMYQKGKYMTFLAIVDYVEKRYTMEEIFKDTKMKREVHCLFE